MPKNKSVDREFAIANPDDPDVLAWLKELDSSTVMDRMMAKRIRELQVANKIGNPKKLFPFVGSQ